MMVDYLHAWANVTLVLLVMRFLIMKLSPDNPLRSALAFIYN